MFVKKKAIEFGNRAVQKLFGVKPSWYKELDIIKNNYRLGLTHLEQGRYSDAAFRFSFLTWLEPDHQEGWFQLARANIGLNKKNKAIAALKKLLALNAEHAEGKTLYLIATGKMKPPKALEITPEQDANTLYFLHKESFPIYWKESEIAEMLLASGTQAWVARAETPQGMLMTRAQFEQAEILTIAVSPNHRRHKVAQQLIGAAELALAKAGVKKLFLEVAENNVAAVALYRKLGFSENNRRKGYYKQADNSFVDALVMSKELV